MKKDSKQQIAYQFIRNRILEGTYVQGQRIVIDTIGKELQLSPIPVREAIRRLEAEGLVTIKAYSGAIVSFVNENEYYEVLSTLSVLEGYAVSISLPFITEKQIEELSVINSQILEALKQYNFLDYIELNKKFHLHTIVNCPNKTIYTLIGTLWNKLDTIRRLKPLYFPTRAMEAIKEHEDIIHGLENKVSPAEVEVLVREHHIASIKKV
jgi:DNA-binding GntR family transcriptional regulator